MRTWLIGWLLVAGSGWAGEELPANPGGILYQPCVSCHGGQAEGGPQGPRLARQQGFYLESRMQDFAVVHRELALDLSPPAASDRQDLIRHLTRLSPPPVPDPAPAAGDRTLGEEIFQENCAYCHGENGQGRSKPKSATSRGGQGPSLVGQSTAYLRRQIALFWSGQRDVPKMRREVASLSQEDIDHVLTFIQTLSQR